jgi:hypothetical protein
MTLFWLGVVVGWGWAFLALAVIHWFAGVVRRRHATCRDFERGPRSLGALCDGVGREACKQCRWLSSRTYGGEA